MSHKFIDSGGHIHLQIGCLYTVYYIYVLECLLFVCVI